MVYHMNSYSHDLVRNGQDTAQHRSVKDGALSFPYISAPTDQKADHSEHIPFPAHLVPHEQVSFQRAVSPAWHKAEPCQVSSVERWQAQYMHEC